MSGLFNRLLPTPTAAFQDTEHGRAFLQTRLSRLSRLLFIVSVGFYPLGIALRGLVGLAGKRGLSSALTGSAGHLLATLILLCVWLYTRKAERSMAVLRAVDVAMTIGTSWSLELRAQVGPPWIRSDMFATLVVAELLAIRAAFIPCCVAGFYSSVTSSTRAPVIKQPIPS